MIVRSLVTIASISMRIFKYRCLLYIGNLRESAKIDKSELFREEFCEIVQNVPFGIRHVRNCMVPLECFFYSEEIEVCAMTLQSIELMQ